METFTVLQRLDGRFYDQLQVQMKISTKTISQLIEWVL